MKGNKCIFGWSVVVLAVFGFLLFSVPVRAQESAAPSYTTRDLNEQLVMATLWVQTSAEFRALCYQAFNLARMNLDAFLDGHTGPKPVAVITDVDETILDNSAYEAFLIGNDFGYSSETWNPWMAAAQATAVPGAVDFLNYAKDRGVETFYVTNRKQAGFEGTEKNLKALGFPFVDAKHLLVRTDSRDKQPRRDQVAKDYAVALLIGDNLNDFSGVFRDNPIAERFAETDKARSEWGTRFIVIPNPTYGNWEGAIFDYNWGAPAAEKDKMRKSHLNRWDHQP